MATYNSNRWNEWMRASLAGDKNAYRLLLSDLQPWLKAYFSKRIHSEAVEDLIQDTMMALHSKRHTYNEEYPFGPWISAIARHKWIDCMRKTLKHVETEISDEHIVHNEKSYEGHKHDVHVLLKEIAPEQAKVIEMVKLKDMTIKEVSEKTGHSQSSVKVMVHRGMKRMMAVVKEKEYE